MAIQINGTSGISGVDGSAGTPALQGTDSNTGISFGTDTVNINTGGTTRATVDSSGRLLVGTSTGPSGGGGQYSNLVVQGFVGNAAGGGDISLQRGQSATSLAANSTLGELKFNDSLGGTFASVSGVCDGTPGTNDYPGRLVFSVTRDGEASPTERFRISSAGTARFFGSEGSGIRIIDSAAGSATNTLISGNHSGTSTTAEGTNSFVVRTNGNVLNTNNSYAGISDIKLKENIVDAASQWDDLKALQVRKYNFKEETGHQTFTQIGLIAQEVELVSPGLVAESPDRDADGNDLGTVTKSVNYSVLYMKAVKALQEAMERIETLETRVAQLEGGAS